MKITAAPFSGKRLPRRTRRLYTTLCVLLMTAGPALAEPVRLNQVVQTLTSSKGTPDLKLNTLVSQDPGSKGSSQQTGPRSETATVSQDGTKTGSILSGVTINSEGQQIGVEVIEEGEVEGTICDCGEILIAGGGFPKWPLLFLAAVPLAFIHDCDSCDENPSSTPTPTPSTPTPTPTPTPTSTPVPEPASLLLFGTGLVVTGAGLRRRYAKAKVLKQEAQGEE